MPTIEALRRFFFGEDVFISYSRRDGAEYALALAGELTRRGVVCFLDQFGTSAGRNLPPELVRTLQRSRMLVIVGTAGAAESESVGVEIATFQSTKRPIIPITFGTSTEEATLSKAAWYDRIRGIAEALEPVEAVRQARPAAHVVDRIVNARGFTRRNRRLRSVFWATLAGVIVLACAAALIVWTAEKRTKKADTKAKQAEAKATEAEAKATDADAQTRAAQAKLAAAVKATLVAQDQKRDAIAARNEANRQRAEAELLGRQALAQRFAAESESALAGAPRRSLELAVRAVRAFTDTNDPPVIAAERALWRAAANNGGTRVAAHQRRVTALAISADGRRMATAAGEEIVLWDITSAPKKLAFFEPELRTGNPIVRLAFSGDGRSLLANRAGGPMMFDVGKSIRHLHTFQGLETNAVGFSPDRRWAVAAADDFAFVCDTTAAETSLQTLEGSWTEDYSHHRIVVSDDFHWLIARDSRTDYYRSDWSKPTETPALFDLTKHEYGETGTAAAEILGQEVVYAIGSSRDGRWLAASMAGMLRVWPLHDGKPGPPVDLGESQAYVTRIVFSPDSCWLAAMNDTDEVQLRELSSAESIKAPFFLGGHAGAVTHLAFSGNGRWLATGGRDRDDKGIRVSTNPALQLWDLNQPTVYVSDPRERRFEVAPLAVEGQIADLAFSADSRWLLDRSEEPDSGAVHAHLWRMTMHGGNPTPVERRELRGHDGGVTAVAFAPNGRTLITGGADGDLRRWDLNGRRNWVTGPRTLLGEYDDNAYSSVDIDHGQHWLVGLRWPYVAHLWDLTRTDDSSPSVIDDVRTAAITAQGQWLVTLTGNIGKDAGMVRLYSLEANDPIKARIDLDADKVAAMAVSADGSWLAAASDGTVRVWDLRPPKPRRQGTTLRGASGKIDSLLFSPNGQWLVAVMRGSPPLLWRLARQTEMPVKVSEGPIMSAAFSSDSSRLATGGPGKGEMMLWDLATMCSTELPDSISRPWTVQFSGNGRWLLAAEPDVSEFDVVLWEISGPPHAALRLKGWNPGLQGVYPLSPDGRWLVAPPSNNKSSSTMWESRPAVGLWDLERLGSPPKPVAMLLPGDDKHAVFSADGRWLLMGRQSWDLHASDVEGSRIEFPSVARFDEAPVRFVTVSRDNRSAIICAEDRINIYPLDIRDLLRTVMAQSRGQ